MHNFLFIKLYISPRADGITHKIKLGLTELITSSMVLTNENPRLSLIGDLRIKFVNKRQYKNKENNGFYIFGVGSENDIP